MKENREKTKQGKQPNESVLTQSERKHLNETKQTYRHALQELSRL